MNQIILTYSQMQVLTQLCEGASAVPQLCSKAANGDISRALTEKRLNDLLQVLLKAGLVKKLPQHKWSITPSGTAALDAQRPLLPMRLTNSSSRWPYEPKELLQSSRPGAMNASAIKSFGTLC
jgi:hypothetical protein